MAHTQPETSTLPLPPEHVKAIDQLRMRLSGLSTSIGLLLAELQSPKHDPLLAWPELQKASVKLGANLEALASALSSQRQLFTSLHVYPLPTFPGDTQEALLQQLLRKKLETKAEDWIEESVHISDDPRSNGAAGVLKAEDMRDLWSSAMEIQQAMVAQLTEDQVWDDDYTIREREMGVDKVITGLKRKLDQGEEDEEDDDDDDVDEDGEGKAEKDDLVGEADRMDVDGPQAPAVAGLTTSLPPLLLDSVLKYAHGQDVP